MDELELESYLQHRIDLIEQGMEELLAPIECDIKGLINAARYALFTPGKRIRPIFVLATTESLKGSLDAALHTAIAIELIHTYSLIHDDLPCMDNDDFRRGKLTTHKAFSESTALLAGNALLTHAFDLISQDEKLPVFSRLEIISLLAKACGFHGMIGGQYLDIDAEGKKIDQEQLRILHIKKTGCLIAATLEAGAIIGKASSHQRSILRQFAFDLGLAYQIRDDLLDVLHPIVKRGTKTSSDAKNQKSTYITLLGVDESLRKLEDLQKTTKHHLRKLSIDDSILSALSDKILSLDKTQELTR